MSTESVEARTPQHELLLQKLSLVEEALQTGDPRMKDHLKESHRLLISHEELAHLLSIEEVAKLMAGQQKHVNTVLVGSMTGKSGKTTAAKKATGLGLGDL
jgi:hypothetical protein